MPIDLKEYRNKDDAEVRRALADLQRKHFDLRTQAVVEKVEDTSQFGKLRRDVARFKTLLRQRELAAQTGTTTNQ